MARDYYGGHFTGMKVEGLRLTLRKVEERPAALSGFVAEDGTVWKLDEQDPSAVVPVNRSVSSNMIAPAL